MRDWSLEVAGDQSSANDTIGKQIIPTDSEVESSRAVKTRGAVLERSSSRLFATLASNVELD